MVYLHEIALSNGDTWDANLYKLATIAATGNVSITADIDTPGGAVLIFIQDATGSRTLTINGVGVDVNATGETKIDVVRHSLGWNITPVVFGGTPENITPDAPTGGTVDDDANTFTFTLNPSYAASEHEYSINGGAYADCSSNVISVGDISVAIGGLLVRVKAATGRNASATLSNATAFTVATAFTTTGLVGYWKESDMVKSAGKVTSWPEASGTGKDWTAVATVEPTDAGADGLQSVNPQQMTLAAPISFTGAFSLYFWIKRTGAGTMLSAGTGSYYAYMDGTSVQSKFNSNVGASTNNNAVPADVWKVVCITYSGVDGDFPKLYIDGTLVGTYGGGNVYWASGYTIANLLGADAGINFAGYLKRLRIYNLENNATDVATNSTALIA